MSNHVLRYDSEQEYLDYTNHQRYLATGKHLTDFPDFGKDGPDEYWMAYRKLLDKYPFATIECWTILEREDINQTTGKLERQHCHYDVLFYENKEANIASQARVNSLKKPSPGVVVSPDFKTLEEAERCRAGWMTGHAGGYYDIGHKTECALVTAAP